MGLFVGNSAPHCANVRVMHIYREQPHASYLVQKSVDLSTCCVCKKKFRNSSGLGATGSISTIARTIKLKVSTLRLSG